MTTISQRVLPDTVSKRMARCCIMSIVLGGQHMMPERVTTGRNTIWDIHE